MTSTAAHVATRPLSPLSESQTLGVFAKYLNNHKYSRPSWPELARVGPMIEGEMTIENPHVLIVEDEAPIREGLTALFESQGFVVTAVGDGL